MIEILILAVIAYFLFSGKVFCQTKGILTPAQRQAQAAAAARQQQLAAGYKAPTTAQTALSTAGTLASLFSSLLKSSQTVKPQTPTRCLMMKTLPAGGGGSAPSLSGGGGGGSPTPTQREKIIPGYTGFTNEPVGFIDPELLAAGFYNRTPYCCCGASRGAASNAELNAYQAANPDWVPGGCCCCPGDVLATSTAYPGTSVGNSGNCCCYNQYYGDPNYCPGCGTSCYAQYAGNPNYCPGCGTSCYAQYAGNPNYCPGCGCAAPCLYSGYSQPCTIWQARCCCGWGGGYCYCYWCCCC